MTEYDDLAFVPDDIGFSGGGAGGGGGYAGAVVMDLNEDDEEDLSLSGSQPHHEKENPRELYRELYGQQLAEHGRSGSKEEKKYPDIGEAESTTTAEGSSTQESKADTKSTAKKRIEATDEMPMPVVAIIGSAGRTAQEMARMNPAMFDKIKKAIQVQIFIEWDLTPGFVALASGGSAGVDHAPVRMWLDSFESATYAGLLICQPAPMRETVDPVTKKVRFDYMETGPGGEDGARVNKLHRDFAKRLGHSADANATLHELFAAKHVGATQYIDSHPGFKNRNTLLSKSVTHAIALTWSAKDATEPATSGTKDTWDKFPKHVVKVHISLDSLC